MLSELSAFINGASHCCAAMPLTKVAISDFGLSSNPIKGSAPARPLCFYPCLVWCAVAVITVRAYMVVGDIREFLYGLV